MINFQHNIPYVTHELLGRIINVLQNIKKKNVEVLKNQGLKLFVETSHGNLKDVLI